MEVNKISRYSWDVINDNIAIKNCDKTFFNYGETGIPIEIISYWDIEKISPGYKREIELIFKARHYQAIVSININNRCKLSWYSDLQKEFNDILSNTYGSIAMFIKKSMNVYEVELYSEGDRDKIEECLSREATFENLKILAEKSQRKKVSTKFVTVQQRARSYYVAEYAKRRAEGICQLCGKKAPFVDLQGNSYLESHHIIWLSKGGEDTIENTVALCPNCHRKMHIVNDKRDVDYLKQVIKHK